MSEYKVVPVEPTAEMRRKAGLSRGADYYTITKVWRAMLDAAPQPPHGAHVMSDPVIRRVRRSIDEAKNRGGMRVGMPKVTIDASDAERLCIMAEALAAAPAVQGEPGVKWAPEEVANGNKGIRWVSDEGVHGRPTDHDCRVYLESNPNARGCHCPECSMLYTAPQPAAHQPCPEAVREGAPYDDPAFSALCREHEIWGTPAAAQCAVFWEAGKRVAEQGEVQRLREALETIAAYPYSRDQEMGATAMRKVARDALAAYRKGGEV